MVEIRIRRTDNTFVIDPFTLPDSMAGMENVFDLEIINDTPYDLMSMKIKPQRNDVELKHPDSLKAKHKASGILTFNCPEGIEEDEVEIQLMFYGLGRKSGDQ